MTVLSVGHHPGIILLFEIILLNELSKAFWAATSFLHQKVCTPSIPGVVQFFLLLISLVSFSVSVSNSFITVTFSPSSLFTSSIQGIFWCFFVFLPNTTPKFDEFLNLRHFSFSCLVSFQCFEKPFWSRWNLMLSCVLFLFLIHFSSLTFLYLSSSIHCSFAIFKLLEVSSLPFALSIALKFLFLYCCLSPYFPSKEFIDAALLSPSLISILVYFLH